MAASLLWLPEDCLNEIISFVDDSDAFYDLALTCKKLHELSCSEYAWNKILHPNILRSKAIYFLEILVHGRDHKRPRKLCADVLWLLEANNVVSYPRVIDMWEKNGPVAAKLLTWLRKQVASPAYRNWSLPVGCDRYFIRILHLPRCKEKLIIKISYHGRFKENARLVAECGALKATYDLLNSFNANPRQFQRLRRRKLDDELRSFAWKMRPVINLLQQELGETEIPLTNRFLFWVFFHFPKVNDLTDLWEEDRMSFADCSQNDLMNQPEPEEFQKHLKFQLETIILKWKLKLENDEESLSDSVIYAACEFADIIYLLGLRCEVRSIRGIAEHGERFFHHLRDPSGEIWNGKSSLSDSDSELCG